MTQANQPKRKMKTFAELFCRDITDEELEKELEETKRKQQEELETENAQRAWFEAHPSA